MDKLELIEKEMLDGMKKNYPEFSQGDEIRVNYIIREGDKKRIHAVDGIVLELHGAMHKKSFTLRRTAYGEAYEVIFPYYSPNIDSIEIVRKSHKRPRRKNLIYLRSREGKQATEV